MTYADYDSRAGAVAGIGMVLLVLVLVFALGLAVGIYAGQATCAKPQAERSIAKPHVLT